MTGTSLLQEQKQTLTTAQMQSLKVLSMNNQELEGFLTAEYLENPLLDCSRDLETTMLNDLENMYEKGISYKEHVIGAGETFSDPGDDHDRRGDIRAALNGDVEDMILGQLDLKSFDGRQISLFRYLIQCLDEKGFFTSSPGEIASVTMFMEDEVISALSLLKKLEPPGVFSSDIAECLVIQLERKGTDDPALIRMIKECMPDILSGRLGNVTRSLGISTSKVKEYIRLIGTLDPRPFMNVEREEVRFIVPDVLAEYREGKWNVSLNDNWIGEYKYDSYYISMMKSVTDPELKKYFSEKLKRARFVIDTIEQRRQTILRVASAILDMQTDHFLVNAELKPMTLKDVADITKLHPSTVSRAIQGKYLQYRSAVLMKSLFTQAAGSENEDVNAHTVIKRIKALIMSEDSSRPLSDAKIAKLLETEGISVKRRTVAKYRMQEGIPDSRMRRV